MSLHAYNAYIQFIYIHYILLYTIYTYTHCMHLIYIRYFVYIYIYIHIYIYIYTCMHACIALVLHYITLHYITLHACVFACLGQVKLLHLTNPGMIHPLTVRSLEISTDNFEMCCCSLVSLESQIWKDLERSKCI